MEIGEAFGWSVTKARGGWNWRAFAPAGQRTGHRRSKEAAEDRARAELVKLRAGQ